MLLITEIPQQETRMFNSISLKNEIPVETKKPEIIDYMITVYPRNELKSTFNFVYSIFDAKELSFSINQDSLLHVANKMFEGSRNLSDFEQKILSQTFRKSVKYFPTLPGRK